MKLCQFKTKGSNQRLGVLIGDDTVGDVAELARAIKSAGGAPADWLLEANSTHAVIRAGKSAPQEIASLRDGAPRAGRGQTVAYSFESIEFLPAVYPSKIM